MGCVSLSPEACFVIPGPHLQNTGSKIKLLRIQHGDCRALNPRHESPFGAHGPLGLHRSHARGSQPSSQPSARTGWAWAGPPTSWGRGPAHRSGQQHQASGQAPAALCEGSSTRSRRSLFARASLAPGAQPGSLRSCWKHFSYPHPV